MSYQESPDGVLQQPAAPPDPKEATLPEKLAMLEREELLLSVPARRFVIDRTADITGISGTGLILYGVEWTAGGPCDVYWIKAKTTGQYPSLQCIKDTHCYNNNARIIFLDAGPDAFARLQRIEAAARTTLSHLNWLDGQGALTLEEQPMLEGLRHAFSEENR